MNNLPILYRAASAPARVSWIRRIFGAAGSGLRGFGRFLGGPWVTAAFIGYEIYHLYNDSSSDSDPAGVLADESSKDNINTILYPDSVIRSLTEPISDASAVAQAFATSFIQSTISADPLARMRITSYATIADYLPKAPDVNTIIYSADRTEILLSELADVLASDDMSEQEKTEINNLKLSAADIAEAPIGARRVLDFTAHLVTILKEEYGNEEAA